MNLRAFRLLCVLLVLNTWTLSVFCDDDVSNKHDNGGIHVGGETSVEDVRKEIEQDIQKLNTLKTELVEALKVGDKDAANAIQKEVKPLFNDIQFKWDVLEQVYEISKGIETDLDHIVDKWPEFHLSSDTNHTADSLIEGLEPPTHGAKPVPDMHEGLIHSDDSQEGTENDTETDKSATDFDPEFQKALLEALTQLQKEDSTNHRISKRDVANDIERLLHSDQGQNAAKALLTALNEASMAQKTKTLNTAFEERSLEMSTKSSRCSAMPKSTWAASWIETKETESNNGASCAQRVKDKANDIKKAIEKIHKIAQNAAKLKTAVNGLHAVLTPLSKMPIVGTVATVAKATTTTIKNAIGQIEPKIKKIDSHLYPNLKNKMKTLRDRAGQVKRSFDTAASKCKTAGSHMDRIIDCLCVMGSSSPRTDAMNAMESSSNGVEDAPYRGTADSSYSSITSTCNTIDSKLNTLMNALKISALDAFDITLSDIINALGPMLDVFREIELAFNQKACIPNPIEATREAGERSREWTAQAAEDAAEWTAQAAEDAWEVATGWRRRKRAIEGSRSTNDVFLSKSEADDFLSKRMTRSTKAADICLSVRDIIDGVSAVFDFLLGWAQDLINDLISQIPGLPTLPSLNIDFSFLELFDVNFNFDLPSLNMNWAFLDWLPPTLPGNLCAYQPPTFDWDFDFDFDLGWRKKK